MNLLRRVLASLNASQREAVTAPCSGVLQIVAGPGTGKTKVLVSRVAYLLVHEKILPHNIIVTTFTKKAANEMMERLRDLFQGTDIAVGNLFVGTFHSICFKILLKYGKLIGIENYRVADDRDSAQVLKKVLSSELSESDWELIENLAPEHTSPFRGHSDSDKYRGLDPRKLRGKISQLKAAGISADALDGQNPLVNIVYSQYQNSLAQNRLLDFDDCLLYCHRLISKFPVLRHIRHTLVDEFQDTNEIQLQLMYEFARGNPADVDLQHNVTIVGDPDQSIYAFRHAQSGNFDTMRAHYTEKHDIASRIITLSENYRSTADILHTSEQIMRQQTNRMSKNLRLQLDTSFKPLKAHLQSAGQEARWLAFQIGYLKKFPDLFEYSDMAILARSSFQTRAIESELSKRGIPYFMVRGKAFWERKEVVAIVDYLRCVSNEDDPIAYFRCVNFPKRGLGPKSVAELENLVQQQKAQNPDASVLVHQILCDVASLKLECKIGPKLKKSLGEFLSIVENAREQLNEALEQEDEQEGVAGLDSFFMDLYDKSGIKKEFSEYEYDLNIMEVKLQLMAYTMAPDTVLPDFEEWSSPSPAPEDVDTVPPTGTEFLQSFLSLVTLFDTDPEANGGENKPRVAISTIHGAKGLEWPVVFVPGVGEGLLPASFAEDTEESINEERRCLYVATSRAKALLHVSSYTEEEKWGRKAIDRPSRFLDKLDEAFAETSPIDSVEKLDTLYGIMGRARPADFDFDKVKRSYDVGIKPYVYGIEAEFPTNTGFTSVSKLELDMNTTRDFGKQKSGKWKLKRKRSGSPRAYSTDTSSPVTALSAPGKAPAYIPMRPKTSSTMNMNPGRVSLAPKVKNLQKSVNSSGDSVNRAPAYIPVRTGQKRRLGTR